MFKAVYFHKTVRAAEVMLIESLELAYDELNLSSQNLEDYVRLTDDFVLEKLVSLPTYTPELERAKKYALDYQNRELFKCVFERVLTSTNRLDKIHPGKIRQELSKKSKVTENEIFVDTSVTPSIPLTPSKKESQSIILISRGGNRIKAELIPISKIPLVSTMSGFMNILRVYTPRKNRKKVEIAAKSILGGLK
jgi:HD superfamily phosphohydrolase